MPETSVTPSVSHRAERNHVNTAVPVKVSIYVYVYVFINIRMYSVRVRVFACVCVFTYIWWPLCSSPGATPPACHSHIGFTSSTPNPRHPTLPERCHSHARLTADIIKAVWLPDMLLAQSRNADRHRATWFWHMKAQYGWWCVCMYMLIC